MLGAYVFRHRFDVMYYHLSDRPLTDTMLALVKPTGT